MVRVVIKLVVKVVFMDIMAILEMVFYIIMVKPMVVQPQTQRRNQILFQLEIIDSIL
jgi:hypothetical protein